MYDALQLYFSYPFVKYAFVVGILIALSSALLGVPLVLKRFSLIGDGLSHVSFGAISIAAAFNITSNMLVVLPVTIAAAILLLRTGDNARIKGDSAIAMISVGALALGYMMLNLFSKSANIAGDVCTTLFGSASILTLTPEDVWLCIILSVIVIAVYILFYNKIFAITFDETFSMATGIKTNRYNMLLAVITASVIVLAMKLVGALLISALIVFPSLSAMKLFKSFKAVIICSATLSVVCAASGLLISLLASTPVGATIVCIDIFAFVIALVIGCILKR